MNCTRSKQQEPDTWRTDGTWCGWTHLGGIAMPQLQRSAKAGCIRCRVLVEAVQKYKFRPYTEPQSAPSPNVEKSLQEFTKEFKVHVSSYETDPLYVSVEFPAMTMKTGCLPLELFLYSDAETPSAFLEVRSGGHIPADSSSNECFKTIKRWINDCDLQHPSCAPFQETYSLPTRLLCTSSLEKDIKLCQSSEVSSNARYLAVSHTWGPPVGRVKPMPLLLTTNINERRQRIAWDELTKTFQDAVVIARKLGIRYLWIDSLCIMQDNAEDWAFEASRMASVYKSAYIVAAATASRNGDDGFFKARSPSYDIATCISHNQLANVYVQRQICHRTIVERQMTTGTMPLLDRAWCFQERLLARRIIHYTEDEIMWECQEKLWCECRVIENPSFHGKTPTTGNFKLAYADAMSQSDVDIRLASWAAIVAEYGQRALTVNTDRLPALSGIAKDMALPGMGRYLAGMWESQFPRALLWEQRDGLLERQSGAGARPFKYQAPTWSWASISSSALAAVDQSKTLLCKLLEVNCTLVSDDPHGQVSHGYVRLLAPATAVYLHRTEKRINDEFVYGIRSDQTIDSKDLDVSIHRDITLTASVISAKILVMMVDDTSSQAEISGKNKKEAITTWKGLVLVSSATHEECWERVGTAFGKDLSTVQCSDECITLV